MGAIRYCSENIQKILKDIENEDRNWFQHNISEWKISLKKCYIFVENGSERSIFMDTKSWQKNRYYSEKDKGNLEMETIFFCS